MLLPRPGAVAPPEDPGARPPGTAPVARGRRTTLWEFSRADVDRWVAWPRHADPLFEGYNPPHLTPRQRDFYYRQVVQAADARQWAVENDAGDLVGRISLREADWRAGVAVLGLTFHPGMLDRGYGTDALWAFLEYYFGPLEMRVLLLDVAAFNARARRVYEKCGFTPRGQRWGPTQPDLAGVYRRPELQSIRHLFHWEQGMVRPLLLDMALRREEWQRWREQHPGGPESAGAERAAAGSTGLPLPGGGARA